MLQADREVREVLCSETNKPMPKIPSWMADVKVKFVSEEARSKQGSTYSIIDTEALRRTLNETDEVKDPNLEVELEEVEDLDVGIDDAIEADEEIVEEAE